MQNKTCKQYCNKVVKCLLAYQFRTKVYQYMYVLYFSTEMFLSNEKMWNSSSERSIRSWPQIWQFMLKMFVVVLVYARCPSHTTSPTQYNICSLYYHGCQGQLCSVFFLICNTVTSIQLSCLPVACWFLAVFH